MRPCSRTHRQSVTTNGSLRVTVRAHCLPKQSAIYAVPFLFVLLMCVRRRLVDATVCNNK